MKYSIVIPTYNHCDDLLKPCIESLIKYTDFSQTELVIVANGCTDNTKEYVNSLNLPVKLLWFDDPLGYTISVNHGIKKAAGEYVILLNNDTEILGSAFNQWLQILEKPFLNDEKMAMTGSLKLFDHDIQHDFIVFCCAMIKREIFEKIGYLDEIYSPGYGEDIDFSMRVLDHGYKWKCIDETTLIDGMNVGTFPLWHKSNKTFGELPEYYGQAVQKNRQTLMKRYNTTMNTPKYSIVIPTYNHCDDLLRPCIESIEKYTDLSNVEVIIVANGCTDNTRAYAESLGPNYKLVWIQNSAGYTKATNEGIRVAKGEYVILMNNDIELLAQEKNKWLQLLEQPFSDKSTGVTGPVKFSWDCGGVNREAMAFWLVMMKRELFDKIGILDEVFSPGMGEDGDFCVRAVEHGYKLVSVPNDVTGEFTEGIKNFGFPIFHKGNGTFADNVESKNAVIDRNNRILADRWGTKSKKKVDISIVIPTSHNFINALKPGLEAVLAYTDLSNKEIIVVANGSPEESRQMLDSLADKVSYIWFDEPVGVIRAYNAGIEQSRGKHIVLLDDDSILLPQTVDSWINILKTPFDEDVRVGASGPFAHEYQDMGFVLHSGCAMYDARLLKNIGMFDEIFNPGYFSDPDVSMRIWKAGYKCVEVPAHNPSKTYQNNVFSINFPVMHLGNVQTMDKNKDIDIVTRNREILYKRHGKKNISASLQYMFDYCANTPIDIHEHMHTLRKYASECDHITEFGTRFVVSTYGFLAGLPKKMLSYDLTPHPNIWKAASIAGENNIEFGFMERNTIQVEIEPTDLLFIDTEHSYKQLITELNMHANKARKYIIMHDTETYGRIDEDGSPGGLMKAVEEFLEKDKSWVIKERFTNCNGLLVLERVKPSIKYSIVIPTYNHCDDLLRPCIESIEKYTDMTSTEIIVSANGCTDNTREYVESLGDHVKLVWSDEALGYTKATNLGIAQSTGEYVVLLNNDTELLAQPTNQWLDMLENPFKQEENVGLTGPLELYDRYAASNVLIFFCVMIKRDLFAKIGVLDEIFTPGGGEDIDFTVRANLAGYKSKLVAPTSFSNTAGTNTGSFPIWHKDNRTFRDIPEYSRHIVKRNGLINCKRFNKNIKLNLGAGGIEYEGYLSVDKYDSRAHIDMDITKLDFEDNSVTEILASHVFEHLNPYKSIDILTDWLRVLKPGGKLVMEMPDIEQLCKRFATASTGERYGILNAIYGSVNTTSSGEPGDITSPHLFGWWPQSMYDHLVNSGYTNIVFMDEKIPHPESNFRVEAFKPGFSLNHDDLKKQSMALYDEIFMNDSYRLTPADVQDKVVVDIGANIGFFTLKCLEMGAKKCITVEANPNVYKRLLTNVAGNPRVVAMNNAALDIDGKIVHITDSDVMSTLTSGAGEAVATVSLKTLVGDIDDNNMLLKLDCEGSEFDILLNTEREVIRKFRTVHMEIHSHINENPEYKNVEVVRNRMISLGYNRVSCVPIMNFQWDANGTLVNQYEIGVYVEKWERV
jgi:FkbM family methyltransferase